jgi:hypothetical protein
MASGFLCLETRFLPSSDYTGPVPWTTAKAKQTPGRSAQYPAVLKHRKNHKGVNTHFRVQGESLSLSHHTGFVFHLMEKTADITPWESWWFCQLFCLPKETGIWVSTLPCRFLGFSALTVVSTWESGDPFPQLCLGRDHRQKMRCRSEGAQKHNAWRLGPETQGDVDTRFQCMLSGCWTVVFQPLLEAVQSLYMLLFLSIFPTGKLYFTPNYSLLSLFLGQG